MQSSDVSTKKWTYYTRNQDFDFRGLEKKLYNVKVIADDGAGIVPTNTSIWADGAEISSGGTWDTQASKTLADIKRFKPDQSDRDVYACQVKLTDVETEVDAISFIWRPKTVK